MQSLLTQEKKRRILTILMQRCEFTEELREAQERQRLRADVHRTLRAVVRPRRMPRAAASGHDPRPQAIASRALHALILGLFNDWLRDPRLFDPDTDAEHLLEPMFRGLVRDWARASSAP
ncbi:hypothetical protein P4054_02335 [Pseudomonas aeruginosa]|nr:hypothetical protein [Pseudomonas aeruginosa]